MYIYAHGATQSNVATLTCVGIAKTGTGPPIADLLINGEQIFYLAFLLLTCMFSDAKREWDGGRSTDETPKIIYRAEPTQDRVSVVGSSPPCSFCGAVS